MVLIILILLYDHFEKELPKYGSAKLLNFYTPIEGISTIESKQNFLQLID